MHTFFQTNTVFRPQIDLGTDGVLVYVQERSLSDRTLDTIQQFQKRGYAVLGMISASHDYGGVYTNGLFDGRCHNDEVQRDIKGVPLMIGLDTYYMVPTKGWQDYLFHFCKNAVDAGLQGIVLEEPEFWFRAGYSPAFRDAYVRQHKIFANENGMSEYYAGLLKADMYYTCIQEVARRTKAYTAENGFDFRIYIAEHSLVNYSSWHITCPTANFANISEIDGIIGQVWTGTARSPKTYEGVTAEHIFETAFLEYSFFDQMALATSKEVFLLADPVEDAVDYNTSYTWENYRAWYTDTVVAQLMQRNITQYEIMPWPHRVFCEPLKNGRYNHMKWQELYARCQLEQEGIIAGQENAIAAYEQYLIEFYGRPVTFGDYSVDLLRQYKAKIQDVWSTSAVELLEKTILQMARFAWENGPYIPSEYADYLRIIQGIQQQLSLLPKGDVLEARGHIAILTGDSSMYRLDTSTRPIFYQNIPTVHDADNGFFSIALPLLYSGYLVDVIAEEILQHQDSLPEVPDVLIIGLDYFHFNYNKLAPILKKFLDCNGKLLIAGRNARIQRLEEEAPYLFRLNTKIVNTGETNYAYQKLEQNPYVVFANRCCPSKSANTSLVVRRGPYIVGRHYNGRLELHGKYLNLLQDAPVVQEPFIQTQAGNILLKQIDEDNPTRLIFASAGVTLQEEEARKMVLATKGPVGTRNCLYAKVNPTESIRAERTNGCVKCTLDSTKSVIRFSWENSAKDELVKISFE